MKLQILIPQYKETDEVLKPMFDSIALQQNINFDDIGVVIVNDGTDVKLSENFLKSYPFKIEYYQNEHKGVSATRNKCLEYSTADYVMFCDADDMFCNVCGLFIILQQIELTHFDTFVSSFVEETRHPQTKETMYIPHEMDSTFVHGKVHRRKYLIENNIKWNNNLTIHEDSFFNILCQRLTKNAIYCHNPFYLWKWRDESVCRHDPKYILKTYNNMIDSNTALVKEFLKRNRLEEAQMYCVMMIYDAYFTMNKDEWINQDNKEYRFNTELRFKEYFEEFRTLFETIPEQKKVQIIQGLKNRMFAEGLVMESITFDDWIKHIKEM